MDIKTILKVFHVSGKNRFKLRIWNITHGFLLECLVVSRRTKDLAFKEAKLWKRWSFKWVPNSKLAFIVYIVLACHVCISTNYDDMSMHCMIVEPQGARRSLAWELGENPLVITRAKFRTLQTLWCSSIKFRWCEGDNGRRIQEMKLWNGIYHDGTIN